jgi:hypothetical protein
MKLGRNFREGLGALDAQDFLVSCNHWHHWINGTFYNDPRFHHVRGDMGHWNPLDLWNVLTSFKTSVWVEGL